MKEIEINTHAKLNLTLDVVRKRPDGYHDLKMIMQSVTLHDTVTLRRTEETGVRLTTNLGYLPTDDGNIAVKAARLFFQQTGVRPEGLHIHIEKRIPVAAGLAGGSGNGAGVLKGLNRLYETGYTPQQLRELGVRIGADVPFSLLGGTALAEGIGEILTPLKAMPSCFITLVKPPFNISTPKIFGKLRVAKVRYRPDTAGALRALEEGRLGDLARRMYNVLEPVTASEHGSIRSLERRMLEFGALGSIMSGSGPTVFGVFDELRRAENAYEYFAARFADVALCNPFNGQAEPV
ncbi:MAG: 4-(cytidine 5'-diphospho)-2-C-methyl-D-erythritol kinase [Eubacteriales bacterium]|jgi:4-diphosphocytidyl-2-C-methyl-D-erythritol kinase